MKLFKATTLAVALFMGMVGTASAQTTLTSAAHNVNIQVDAINMMAVTGTANLTISSATAGQAPDDATDATTSFALTTNDTGLRISASTDQDPSSLGTGLDLKVTASAPGTGTGGGEKSLSTAAQDVVTGITPTSASGATLSYVLSATAATGQIAATTLVVTYTLIKD